MPREITGLKEFLDIVKRDDCKGTTVYKAKGGAYTKFAARCSRFLYTIKLDKSKAKKVEAVLTTKNVIKGKRTIKVAPKK